MRVLRRWRGAPRGMRHAQPGALRLPRWPRESGSPRPILPHWRGRGRRHGGAGGAGAGGGPLVTCSAPGRGAGTAAGTTAPARTPWRSSPRGGASCGAGAGRGENRPPCSSPARGAGRLPHLPAKGWPRAGLASPATQRGCGEPVGSQRCGPVPSLTLPRSVLRARSGDCGSDPNCIPRPSTPSPRDSLG